MQTIPTTVIGLLSLIIVTMGGVIVRLWSDGKTLQNKYDAIQEARRLDAKETTDKVTQPLQSISQTMTLIYDKLADSKEKARQ